MQESKEVMEVAEDSEMQHATTLGIFDSVDYACHIEDTPNHGAFRDTYYGYDIYGSTYEELWYIPYCTTVRYCKILPPRVDDVFLLRKAVSKSHSHEPRYGQLWE